MLCPNCQEEFNSQENTPRILIFCGHTFCHSCIENLLKEPEPQNPETSQKKTVECPECGTSNQVTDGVNSFPKNLVLLQVSTQTPVPQPLSKQNSQKERQLKESTQQKQTSDQPKQLCNIHNKKLEAFCEKDLLVLCIDCILSEQHKSHEIISVQKAVEKQKQTMFDEVSQAQKTEEKLKFIVGDIKRHIGDMHSQAERNRKELSSIYSFVRDLILERETTLKRQISENLTKEEQDADGKLQEIGEFMEQIIQLKQELVNQSQEIDIEILQKAKFRNQIQQDVNGQKSRDLSSFNIQVVANVCQSLNEIKRDVELNQISKIINPTYKGPSIGQTLGQPQGSSLYAHTLSSKMKKNQTSYNVASTVPLQSQGGSSGSLQKEEPRKSNKNTNQAKQKVSPHRAQKRLETFVQNKNKQGVVVLDQNKQFKPNQSNMNSKSKVQASFNNNQASNNINLYNFNYNQSNCQNKPYDEANSEDVLGNCVGDDVSSIYPLETNDCYFQYSPRTSNNNPQRPDLNGYVKPIKRDESVGALNDLLDTLNKSTGGHDQITTVAQQQNQQHLVVNSRGEQSSTASETGGSNNNETPPMLVLQQELKTKAKSSNNVETPKQKKVNPWKANQQSKSGKKKGVLSLKRDNSASELEINMIVRERIISPQKNNSSFNQGAEERKGERVNSLQKYNSNNQHSASKLPDLNLINTDDFDHNHLQTDNKKQLPQDNHLASLSQERAKRKQQKLLQNEQQQLQQQPSSQSPFKNNKHNFNQQQQKESNSVNLMDLLQECTKNIDKLEFKPSAKKQQQKQQQQQQEESPIKLVNSSKAAICVVDLTKKEDLEEAVPLRIVHPQITIQQNEQEKESTIREDEEEEGSLSKNVPNVTSQKDCSPFKLEKTNEVSLIQKSQSSYSNSPNKKQQDTVKSLESIDQMMIAQYKQLDNSLDTSKVSQQQQFNQQLLTQQQDHLLQQSVSVDTSVSDPFRALCRVKEEFIFVFSGFNDQKLLTCEAYDIQRGTWKEICQISKARTKFSAVPISKSRILVFGGKQADGQRTGEIEEFNLKTNKFKTLPFKLPKPRSGFAACVKREEGKIFFCGGNSGSVLKKFDCLDLKKGKWSRWPEMIQKRDELAVALGPDGKIYAIGGYGGGSSSQLQQDQQDSNNKSSSQQAPSNCLRTAERFDFNTGQWEMLPEMNEARRALAAVALPDGIYAIGGYDGKQYLATVEKFDLQKQQWVYVKSMNASRCTLSAVVSNDCQYIYALGGFNGNSLDLVERYNTMTDEWEFITPMNQKRFMHEAVSLITH